MKRKLQLFLNNLFFFFEENKFFEKKNNNNIFVSFLKPGELYTLKIYCMICIENSYLLSFLLKLYIKKNP